MKNVLSISFLTFLCQVLTAQNVAIGTGSPTPDASAVLDLQATDKGLLVPRVANPASISSPATGLMVYNTTTNKFNYYNGATWIEIGNGSGTVTSVSGTAPIVSSGGSTPAISISAATPSAAGSMSSTDKAKLDAIATSFTGLANPIGTIGLTAVNGSATTAVRSDGAPALSQAIVPTWTGIHNFSNATYSALFSGGNVGIGTPSPNYKLDVGGTISSSDGIPFHIGTTGFAYITSASPHVAFYKKSGGYSFYFRKSDNGLISGPNETTLMEITDAGNVGIGITPGFKLHVNGKARIEEAAHAAGADDFNMEIYSPNTGSSQEVSLRFHEGNQFYHQIRCRNNVFRFTAGNNDVGIPIYASSFNSTSDGRLKTNREKMPYGLKEIMALQPLKYFQHEYKNENGVLRLFENGVSDIGLIAQETYKIIPEAAVPPTDEKVDVWGMNYPKLIPVLIKAIQEQEAKIENLERQNNDLKSTNSELVKTMKAELDVIKERLSIKSQK